MIQPIHKRSWTEVIGKNRTSGRRTLHISSTICRRMVASKTELRHMNCVTRSNVLAPKGSWTHLPEAIAGLVFLLSNFNPGLHQVDSNRPRRPKLLEPMKICPVPQPTSKRTASSRPFSPSLTIEEWPIPAHACEMRGRIGIVISFRNPRSLGDYTPFGFV